MPDDIDGLVVTSNLEIAMVGGQPAVENLDHLDFPAVEEKPPGHFLVPVSGIAFNPDGGYLVGFAHFYSTSGTFIRHT